MRRLRLLLFLLPWVIGCSVSTNMGANPTAYYVVRHAEKADLNDPDTPISLEGHGRAKELAQRLGDKAITHVFASEKKRTRQTAEPTALVFGLRVDTIPARDQVRLLERVRAVPTGSHVLIVGHSNTVPSIVRELSGQSVPDIAENAFNNLYTITVRPEGTPTLERSTYGAAPK